MKSLPFIAFLFLVLFFTIEYYFVDALLLLTPYAIYIFELIFIFIAFVLYQSHISLKKVSTKIFTIIGFTSSLTGFLMALMCKVFGINVPFDLKHAETLLMLLLIGPVLEELIYRFALWHYLKILLKTETWLPLIISACFSYGHFFAYFKVPESFQAFILFQTTYTFFLSLVISLDWQQHKNFIRPLLIHLFFNLGFYCGLVA